MPEEYDPALDPTPEDEEITPRDELIILANELETLQAEDFNLWRALRLARLQELIASGVEGDEFVFHPEPPIIEVSEFDDDGFSAELSNGCVAYQPLIETAKRWQGSNDRLLEYAATFMLRNRYMLPIPRLETDEDWQERYRLHLVARGPRFMFGRSGYLNRKVFASFTTASDGDVIGQDVIEDHYCPYKGSNQAEIVSVYTEDWDSGAAKERFLRFAANALAEMDRGNKEKWENYRPIPPSLMFQRNTELDLARINPDY